ncbi:reverse transcriptase domain-containing protein, partial [Tanacetum coccineum]
YAVTMKIYKYGMKITYIWKLYEGYGITSYLVTPYQLLKYGMPYAESNYDSEDMEEEVEYMTDNEVEERSKNTEDALISIIKSIKKEMKEDIMKKQFEASSASISNETTSITSNEDDKDTSITASCLLPKEMSPGSFLLPFNIDHHSLYAITTLEAKDNVMPLDAYRYLGLDKLRDAGTIKNTTGTDEPLKTIDILLKFETLEFLYNFFIKKANDVIILGRPFLESTQVQINVFNEEILF